MFYFEQLLQTALNGIDTANVTSAVLGVAGTILLLSFLYGAYEAFAAGGDVRMLASSGTKYLVLGLVFANYGADFSRRQWNVQFGCQFHLQLDWGRRCLREVDEPAWPSSWQAMDARPYGVLVSWGISGFLSRHAYSEWRSSSFPICVRIFSLFYAMYGSVLYVTGPFVLSLLSVPEHRVNCRAHT